MRCDRRDGSVAEDASLIPPPLSRPAVWSSMRASIRLTIVVGLAVSLVGCALHEGDAEDLIYLHNTTDMVLTVTREVMVRGSDIVAFTVVADFGPGELGYVSYADFDENDCLRGSLVARSGDVIVDEAAGLVVGGWLAPSPSKVAKPAIGK